MIAVPEPPLSGYRRPITASESREIWAKLSARWEITGKHYWYPLSGAAPPHTVAFLADAFADHFGAPRLRSLLAELGVERLYELGEVEPEHEIDLALLAATYKSQETYWTPRGLDWLIYASHESTLTIAGAPLFTALKTAWPNWEAYLWRPSVKNVDQI